MTEENGDDVDVDGAHHVDDDDDAHHVVEDGRRQSQRVAQGVGQKEGKVGLVVSDGDGDRDGYVSMMKMIH